ncbi:PREDICTED: dual oxidase maturation factor 1-like [Priapulus caudatus]|uniref:Dual oxidase maturation factor 1-like n=1 Tax=Priapulus caudatus TaxID=37621 RepID=A0ABM1EBX0_PRICU|nr:PREDICTED: dual oxidase maturation factor 1-like [Priapulus caudatus]XP_014669698.1 PREDICTED: dual oxidase maturation factor 1-like [Priapulus caudatus]XP_014669706.1 PREDICTED: dual oxidase maturation factor 1-like [Priapulus caudatus]
MANGWFDAFRSEGGPTLYGENRTSVTQDALLVALYILFIMFMFAFLIILPGIRKERFKTFFAVTVSLFVGTVILVCTYGSDWHVGEANIACPYKAFSDIKIEARVGVKIGLRSFNITLHGAPLSTVDDPLYYNERISWLGLEDVKTGYKAALVKGLPYPILTVAEYFSVDHEGFIWGRCYRSAGYYSYMLLWTAFAIWLVGNVLFCMVLRYGAYSMILTGVLLLLTNGLYYMLLPKYELRIHFDLEVLRFKLGWCYWLVLATGILCICVGATIAVVDACSPQHMSLIFEMDKDERRREFEAGREEMESRGYELSQYPGHTHLYEIRQRSSKAPNDRVREEPAVVVNVGAL